jgi:hypothetical protein
VAVNDTSEYFAVLEGIEKIAHLIYRYAIFEDVYLRGEQPVDDRIKVELERVLKDLYGAALVYLLKAYKYYRQSAKGMSDMLLSTNALCGP